MPGVLANRTYRRLFLAQAVALAGTGLATVALALLAFELAGEDAGRVLGTALAIKMLAYIGVSLIASAFVDRLPRRAFLVAMDLLRAGIVLTLPFVTEIWQIYLLIFLLQSASAGFTPAFQALIPAVLPAEKDYTRALALTRMAYDLENLFSPMLAAALLSVLSFHGLFAGTALGFAVSALLILGTALPAARQSRRSCGQHICRGLGIYLQTPRLRGLLAVTLAAAASGALVIVHTIVLVKAALGLPERAYALTLAAYGAGSMLGALLLPRLLDRVGDRGVMLGGAALATAALAGFSAYLAAGAMLNWGLLLGVWFLLGLNTAAMLTPAGRLLCRSVHEEDRTGLYAAQFSLSHACWLLAYVLMGATGAAGAHLPAIASAALLSLAASLAAVALWPRRGAVRLAHEHRDLPAGHPHLLEGHPAGGPVHPFIIDDLHRRWPR